MTQTTFNSQLKKFIPLAVGFSLTSILVDAGINTGYIFQGQASNGVSMADVLLCIAFFCIWVMGLNALTKLGLEVLPHANKEKRRRILPIWAGSMVFIGIISVFMSIAQLGGELARHDYNAKVIRQTLSDAEKMIEYQRIGNNVQSIFKSANASLEALYQEEISGNVCEAGNGKGRCAGLLKNLIKTTQASQHQLIELNGQAESIVETIRELEAELQWLQSNQSEGINYKKQFAKIHEKIDLIAQQVEALKQTLPILAITRASDSYNRNWASLGISQIGAKRIQTEVRPIAKRLQPILSSLKNASYITVNGVEHKSEYALLAQSESVRPIIGIAFLLAFMPLMISGCVLILSGSGTPPSETPQADQPSSTIRLNTKPSIEVTKH